MCVQEQGAEAGVLRDQVADLKRQVAEAKQDAEQAHMESSATAECLQQVSKPGSFGSCL